MSTPWTPEREVTAEQARSAVCRSAYPGPADSVEVVAAGWDNTIVLVDGDWVFRFPRREVAVPGILREITWLPRLAPELPSRIPVPTYTGTSGNPGWPFWGATYLAGEELAGRGSDRVTVAEEVGRFLGALHALAPIDQLPLDPMGRADSATRAGRARATLDDLTRLGLWDDDGRIRAVLADGARLGPAPTLTVVSHGDLYSRHVLVLDSRVAGVIDWGDLCMAPAAVDLSIAFSAFDGDSRAALLAAYGPVDDETLLRAQTFAVSLTASLVRYAHHLGDAAMLAEFSAQLATVT